MTNWSKMSLAWLLVISFFISVILLPSANISDGSWIAEAAAPVTANELSVTVTDEANNSMILVVQHADEQLWYTDYALRQLGIPHDTVKVQDFPNTDLSKYGIIIVGTLIGNLEEVKPYLDSGSAEIETWVTSGGCLAVFGQYKGAQAYALNGELWHNLGSGYYEWLPGKPGFVNNCSERVSIVNSSHPMMVNFTGADLSYWDTSADGYFVHPPGDVLAIHEGYPDRPLLYAQILGKGKIVATGLDLDYHSFVYNGNGIKGREKAQEMLIALLSWFGAGESSVPRPSDSTPAPDSSGIPTSISISADVPSSFVGFAVDVYGTLSDADCNVLYNETVFLYYTFPGYASWIPITSDTTNEFGEYGINWIPSATGSFTLKAEWKGNATHSGSSDVLSLSTVPYEDDRVFSVESNSTVSAFAFNSTSWELSFSVSGSDGTTGYVKLTVAKSIVSDVADVKVFLDGKELVYSASSSVDSWLLVFTYSHSTHDVAVSFGVQSESALAEPFLTTLVVAAASGASVAVIGMSLLFYFKKRKR